eukprot:366490-Chlamydomonas_euryale.AAC.34
MAGDMPGRGRRAAQPSTASRHPAPHPRPGRRAAHLTARRSAARTCRFRRRSRVVVSGRLPGPWRVRCREACRRPITITSGHARSILFGGLMQALTVSVALPCVRMPCRRSRAVLETAWDRVA